MKEIERFTDEQSAAAFILRESTKILKEHGVAFIIVGGWVSYLFNRHLFGHPGTYDVDVLLDSSSLDNGSFSAASETMLSRGYMRAAKNQFQVHRALRINNEPILFHVDFLNERDPGDTLEMQTGSGRIKSIYTPAMRVVFEYPNHRRLMSGEFTDIDFPSEETFIASKAAATLFKKRQRDAFDVYVTLLGSNSLNALCERWQHLVSFDGFFRDANDSLWKAVYRGDAIAKIVTVLESLEAPRMPSTLEILETFDLFLEQPEKGPEDLNDVL